MKCVVTGGAGFIGSHLCDLLISKGHEVWVVDDLSTGREKNIQHLVENQAFHFIAESVCDLHRESLPETVDWWFHLAGRADLVPSIQNPEDYYHINVTGTLNALQLARECGVRKFLYTASSTCYGVPDAYPTGEAAPSKPEHPYALTKLMGEELALFWAKIYHLPVLSLCLFNVYGPRSRTTGAYGAVFGVFLKQKLAEKPFTVVGDGEQTRDFTFVTDVAEAFLAGAESDAGGMRLNVGSGNTYSVNRLVELLGGPVEHLPKRPGEPDCTFADISKIQSTVDWNPRISLEEGVQEMLKHIDDWRDAPLWNKETIAEATKDWFKYLKKNDG
ncbi:MAG: GDP-mannose 4,6-dehydratase [Opitutales bacterium]|nr:GDP-mannose 4,6-dehydratase [Opitutales bacterium]